MSYLDSRLAGAFVNTLVMYTCENDALARQPGQIPIYTITTHGFHYSYKAESA